MLSPQPADLIALRDVIRRREQIGITAAQDRLAAMAHVTRRCIQRWETGARAIDPGLFELITIKIGRQEMARHTSGQWGIATVSGGDDEIVTVVDDCLVSIALIFGACKYSEARNDGTAEPHYNVSEAEAAGNARLIAAAPELLAAIREICDAFPSIRDLNSAQISALNRGCSALKSVISEG